MKKVLIFVAVCVLAACVEAGEFNPKRHAMHDLNRTETCRQDSRKCIQGTDIPW